jgi:hypothetical protein
MGSLQGSHCSRVHRDNEWFRNPGSRRQHVIDPACPVWENCPTAGPEGTTRIMQPCTPASSSKSPKVWQTGGLDRSHFAKHNSKKKKKKKSDDQTMLSHSPEEQPMPPSRGGAVCWRPDAHPGATAKPRQVRSMSNDIGYQALPSPMADPSYAPHSMIRGSQVPSFLS